MTNEAKKYQLEHNHFYTATVERTNKSFKFGFADEETSSTSSNETIKGFNTGNTVRIIETVETVDLRTGDYLTLAEIGQGKVITAVKSVLEPKQLRFTTIARADKITKITVEGAMIANV